MFFVQKSTELTLSLPSGLDSKPSSQKGLPGLSYLALHLALHSPFSAASSPWHLPGLSIMYIFPYLLVEFISVFLRPV